MAVRVGADALARVVFLPDEARLAGFCFGFAAGLAGWRVRGAAALGLPLAPDRLAVGVGAGALSTAGNSPRGIGRATTLLTLGAGLAGRRGRFDWGWRDVAGTVGLLPSDGVGSGGTGPALDVGVAVAGDRVCLSRAITALSQRITGLPQQEQEEESNSCHTAP